MSETSSSRRGGAARSGRGGRGGGKSTDRNEEDIRISKKLSRMLRHHPPACMDKSGWVPIEVVKSTLGSIQDTAQILRVVGSDEKGRFQARTRRSHDAKSCIYPRLCLYRLCMFPKVHTHLASLMAVAPAQHMAGSRQDARCVTDSQPSR